MYKRILVPIDGSRTASLGLDEAIRLARDQNASLFLFHVVDTLWMDAEPVHDMMRKEGRKLLAGAEAKVRMHGLRMTSVLAENTTGELSDLIIAEAKKRRADLIVLGTHGRRGIRRMVVGSDAEGVIRSTPVPVLLVRSSGARRSAKKKPRRRASAQP